MSHQRRHPAHPPVILDGRRVVVFVTVCTARRRHILSNPEAAALLIAAWREADEWLVGRYVIMPNHIHLFCSPARLDSCDLRTWIAFWKSVVSKRWPRREELPLWQKDFWDRQLRTGESYGDKWEYVRHNPVRHGLVMRPEDWPYHGEFNHLPW